MSAQSGKNCRRGHSERSKKRQWIEYEKRLEAMKDAYKKEGGYYETQIHD